MFQDHWLDSKISYLQEQTPLYPNVSIRYAIQKFGWDVKSIMLKFPNNQTISLRIINEKQGNAASGMHVDI